MNTDFIATLKALLGSSHVLTDSVLLKPYTIDWRKRYVSQPLAVVFPANTQEVAKLVQLCQQQNVGVVAQGGNTSTCGGATPCGDKPQIILALRRLNRIRTLDLDNNSITVEAGIPLQQVQMAAQAQQRLFPLSLASEGSCQIGGNLSTNAGGIHVLRYGTMRDLTLGLEVVLANGSIVNGLTALRKDTSGLDIKQLFIGAEGQLGIITAATLKLFPLPRFYVTALVGLNSPQEAIDLFTLLRQQLADYLSAYELMDSECQALLERQRPGTLPFSSPWLVLVELTAQQGSEALLLEWFATALEPFPAKDVVIARHEAERARLWKLREELSELQRHEGPSLKHDIALPTSHIPAFINHCEHALRQHFPAIIPLIFGHVGDGNLHYNIRATGLSGDIYQYEPLINQIVYQWVSNYQGTFAAEHGVGQLKTSWLNASKDPAALTIMRQLKQTLDPAGIMNPGKWLDPACAKQADA